MTDTPALRPCPLCGGVAEIWRAYPENPKRNAWVACMDKCLVLTKEFPTTDEAIQHWNRRDPVAIVPDPEDEAMVEFVARAIAKAHRCISDGPDREVELCRPGIPSSMCACQDDARLALTALRDMAKGDRND